MSQFPSKQSVAAWVLLHRANRKLLSQVEDALKQGGLPSLDWYDVLLELKKAGEHGLRQFEISERVLLNKHNLSRLLDRLEKQALVRRENCEEDKRGNRILLTDEGLKLQQSMWPIYAKKLCSDFEDKLEAEEHLELARLLEKLLN